MKLLIVSHIKRKIYMLGACSAVQPSRSRVGTLDCSRVLLNFLKEIVIFCHYCVILCTLNQNTWIHAPHGHHVYIVAVEIMRFTYCETDYRWGFQRVKWIIQNGDGRSSTVKLHGIYFLTAKGYVFTMLRWFEWNYTVLL